MKKEREVIIFKKGKFVHVKSRKFVLALAKKILKKLKPFSEKIEMAGSIRRKEKNPVDIDLVLIPKNKKRIIFEMHKIGKFLLGGEKKSSFLVEGIKVELYYADKTNWGAMLLSYTGPFGAEIGLRIIAKKKGLLMNQYGIFDKSGKRIAGRTESEMFRALGKKYKKPELR